MIETPKNLHRDIMRSVNVVKKRYYLFGLLIAFLIGSIGISWFIYEEMVEEGEFGFISTIIDSIKVDFSLATEFNNEIREIIPFTDLGILLLVLSVLCVLTLIIFRFRKVLFLKVDKFKDGNK